MLSACFWAEVIGLRSPPLRGEPSLTVSALWHLQHILTDPPQEMLRARRLCIFFQDVPIMGVCPLHLAAAALDTAFIGFPSPSTKFG